MWEGLPGQYYSFSSIEYFNCDALKSSPSYNKGRFYSWNSGVSKVTVGVPRKATQKSINNVTKP